ncbi:MAG: protease modulator HflK N-terminal domain-containing protein, partial [Comamonadaceae bacterium]|nr:protease modulator HflK N-terminal domain-containing protein [Comamonadaceae bacterium]
MNFLNRAPRWAVLPERLRGMFNLNDPRWGRGEDNQAGEGEQRPDSDRPVPPPSSNQPPRGQNNQAGQPPDLDELWRDLNRKLSGLFGGKPPRGPRTGGNGIKPPEMKGAGIGVGVIAGIAVLIWLGTGFFIVQEGQQAVITQFGKYHST